MLYTPLCHWAGISPDPINAFSFIRCYFDSPVLSSWLSFLAAIKEAFRASVATTNFHSTLDEMVIGKEPGWRLLEG